MTPEQRAFRKELKAAWKRLAKAIEICPPDYGIKHNCLEPAFAKIDEALVWFVQTHE